MITAAAARDLSYNQAARQVETFCETVKRFAMSGHTKMRYDASQLNAEAIKDIIHSGFTVGDLTVDRDSSFYLISW
jgi:hypothetical protein